MIKRPIALVLLLPIYGLGLVAMGTAALGALFSDDWNGFWNDLLDLLVDPRYWASAAVIAGAVVGSQAVFLLPAIRLVAASECSAAGRHRRGGDGGLRLGHHGARLAVGPGSPL